MHVEVALMSTWGGRRGWRYSSPSGIRHQLFQDFSADVVANLAPSPDVVEASTGDLVDVVLHGQLGVQIHTEIRTTTSHSITDPQT